MKIYKCSWFSTRHSFRWTLLQVRISSGSPRGLHYALCSFTQLLRLSATEPAGHVLVPVLIQDHPAVRHRAVLLDMSPRGRVPTLVSVVWFVGLREDMDKTVRMFAVFVFKNCVFPVTWCIEVPAIWTVTERRLLCSELPWSSTTKICAD
jgi:hypothetical protein